MRTLTELFLYPTRRSNMLAHFHPASPLQSNFTMASASSLQYKALSLYRSLLRAHQTCLPADLRALGDKYVRSEFKLHLKPKTSQAQMQAFVREWDAYLDQITRTARAQEAVTVGQVDEPKSGKGGVFAYGADLPADLELSPEQEMQLEKLREEASKIGKTR
jgi:Complex1_LYR-like